MLREDGGPATYTSISLVPVDLEAIEKVSPSVMPTATTDRTGFFAIDPVLPGRYYLAVNITFGPRLDAPYLTTYYPGGGERAAAQVIEIREGEQKADLAVVVTPLVETVVSGVVLFDDDRTVTEASVTAAPVAHRFTSTSTARSDSSGGFQLRLLSGVTYVIRASARTSKGLRQSEVTVTAQESLDPIRLVIRE